MRSPLPDDLTGYALLVDKPKGWTSFGVVKKVRWLAKIKKVGHAGTLDPMATGLLIVCIGRAATKHIDSFMGLPKRYTGTLRLGQTTPSYDAETEPDSSVPAGHVTDAELEAAAVGLSGDIEQLAPMYSAVKVGGERLYKKARRGETVERKPRHVHVDRFDLTARRETDVDFLIDCSKGTYIRTLAHDLGQAVGVGAHLTALRRERIGGYDVEDAWDLATLEETLTAH
ncbi:MAG: tRNA pseudouridine(55) synthase TruB [Bacteroidota bacterium]